MKPPRPVRNDPDDATSLSNNLVSSFMKDSKGRLWVSTMGGGVDLFHPETRSFTHLRVEDGLGNDGVHGVVEDRQGKLWVSDFGLAKAIEIIR